MAVELESTIMNEIGLGNSYYYFNGSGSCGYIRRSAVDKLQSVASKHGLNISSKWLAHCRTANEVDEFDGGAYSLTNTFIACSYAIQDAIYRKEGGKGFNPTEDWHFFYSEKREQWKNRRSYRDDFDNPFNIKKDKKGWW